MTNQNNAAQAADQDPLSDQFVNAVIRQHGYDSPQAVIARLWQWIGLNGSENGVTLLMYEAHKALVKLRAPVADERADFNAWLKTQRNPDDMNKAELVAAWEAWQERGRRAALASAPVARPKRAPADDWRVTAIAECLEAEWDEMTPDLAEANARIIVGYLIEHEKESALIEAKRASAPVTDELSLEALEHGHRRYELGFASGWDQCAASAPVAGEAVGEIVLFGGELKEVSWRHGKMPPPGTKLYAAPQASEAVPIGLLATEHTGMRVDYSGLLKQARSALEHGETEPALAEMLRQLAGHLEELGQRWYAGDVAVVDELLQLYCVESEVRAALSAQPGAQEGGA